MDYSILNQMLAPPNIMNAKKVLCVQPHPDDNEVGMGGIINELTKKGIILDYLTVTDGSLGAYVPELSGDVLAQVRNKECELSGSTLGVSEYFYLNYQDGSLNNIPELAGKIGEIIRKGEYDFICCPDPWLSYEAHNDHIVTGKATAQAFISANLLEYPKGTMTKPINPVGIGFYFTNKPNTVVDITTSFDIKFEAMAKHQSQFNQEILGLYRMYFTMKGEQLAQDKDFAIGEGLRLMSPLHMHCFVDGENI